MTNFIKLTEAMSGGDTMPLILNISHIVHVQGRLHGKDTHIRMSVMGYEGKQAYYFVKESAEDIWLMINTDYGKAPIDVRYYKNKDGV